MNDYEYDIHSTLVMSHVSCMACYSVLVFTIQLLLYHGAVGDQVEISLNGDSWSLSDTDGRVKGIQAQVPGTVHLDLMYVCYLQAICVEY